MPPTRHSPTEMHRSTDDATGANIAAGQHAVTDGSGGFVYEDAGASGGSGGFEVTPPLTLGLPPRTTPTGTGSMTPHAEGRITDTSGDNRYSQAVAYLEGVLHHFFTEGTTEHAAGSAAYHRKSYDYGETFTTPVSIYAGSGAGRHGNVEGACVTATGRIVVGLQDQDNSSPFNVNPIIKYSDNGGASWSTAYSVPHSFTSNAVPAALLALPNGDVALFMYGEQTGVVGGNTFVRMYLSTDDGATFGDERTVASSASRTYAEPRVVLTDGTVAVFMRSDTNQHTWRTASAVDDLVTWVAAADVISMSGPPDVCSPWPGAIFMVARNNNSAFLGRTAMSWDKGLTWTALVELDSGETRELDGTALWVMASGAVYGIYALLDGPSDSTFYIRRFFDGYGIDHLGNTRALDATVTDDLAVTDDLTVGGVQIDPTGAAVGDALTYNGSAFVPDTLPSGTGDHEHMIDVFNGDASTTTFEISDEPIDPEAVFAFVGGSWTAITVSGAMNTTITFGSAPGSGTGNVVIQYPAVSS